MFCLPAVRKQNQSISSSDHLRMPPVPPQQTSQAQKCPLSFSDRLSKDAAKGKMASTGKGHSALLCSQTGGCPMKLGRWFTGRVTWVALSSWPIPSGPSELLPLLLYYWIYPP